jgi:osmotically inducible protein OsmC
MQKNASAHWEGDLKSGKGTIATGSGALQQQPYGFSSRFEDEQGSNPEELLGAAHAACFSMALSLQLAEANMTAESIDTKAIVDLEESGDGFAIPRVHLDLTAKVPGADPTAFQDAAKRAKEGCPVSKVLKADITLDAKLLN